MGGRGADSGSVKNKQPLIGMSDISRSPLAFQELVKLSIPLLQQQYSDWSSLETALESIDFSPTAHEGNRFQDFESHILRVINQNRDIANGLNEYYDSDLSLSGDILNVLRGKY